MKTAYGIFVIHICEHTVIFSQCLVWQRQQLQIQPANKKSRLNCRKDETGDPRGNEAYVANRTTRRK